MVLTINTLEMLHLPDEFFRFFEDLCTRSRREIVIVNICTILRATVLANKRRQVIQVYRDILRNIDVARIALLQGIRNARVVPACILQQHIRQFRGFIHPHAARTQGALILLEQRVVWCVVKIDRIRAGHVELVAPQ